MPQDNDTLLAQLLQRAGSIGPVTRETPLSPSLGMENQQPDPFLTVKDALGDPMQNMGLEAAPPPGAPGKLFDLIRGGWTDLRPAITTGEPIETLLDMFKNFDPSGAKTRAAREAEQAVSMTKATGRRVPDTPFLNTKSRKLKYPHEMPMQRGPEIRERLAAQRQADAREGLAPKPTGNARSGSALYRSGGARGIANPDIVKTIRQMANDGAAVPDIAAKYPQLKPETIKVIIRKESWAWVK